MKNTVIIKVHASTIVRNYFTHHGQTGLRYVTVTVKYIFKAYELQYITTEQDDHTIVDRQCLDRGRKVAKLIELLL